ncbi:MAG: peptidase, partial [Tardiphaga sp.]|nr:peptidase [Tardiphaga sp.]
MSGIVELLSSRRAPQAAILAMMSFAFSGCSADMQTRLSQDNLSNPFGQREATGTVQRQAPQSYNGG